MTSCSFLKAYADVAIHMGKYSPGKLKTLDILEIIQPILTKLSINIWKSNELSYEIYFDDLESIGQGQANGSISESQITKSMISPFSSIRFKKNA